MPLKKEIHLSQMVSVTVIAGFRKLLIGTGIEIPLNSWNIRTSEHRDKTWLAAHRGDTHARRGSAVGFLIVRAEELGDECDAHVL